MPENGPPAGSWMNASNPVAMGSKPMMTPDTPATVSATAGLHAFVLLICWIVTESGHVAFGNCVAEATPATHKSAVTARNRVNILLMGDPLGAGGRNKCGTR